MYASLLHFFFSSCTHLANSALSLENSVALLKFVRTVFADCNDAGKHVANALWAELQTYVQEKYILDSLPSIYADIPNYHAPTRVAELEKLGSELGTATVWTRVLF